MRATLLLMRKNLKEDLRRPKGFACEMLCPLIVFILLGLLRANTNSREIDINYGDHEYYAKQPIQYDYRDLHTTHKPHKYIEDLICMKYGNPAGYLAIIPPPSTDGKIKHIIDEMAEKWDDAKARIYLHDQVCTACRYGELFFTEDSILKYFNSEDELQAYLNNEDYASKSWDPTNSSHDGIRPISFAIVFDEYENWDSITYTLRGNVSYFPSTEGDKVKKFEHGFGHYWDSGYRKYLDHGMVNIQHWLNQIITEKIATEANKTIPEFQFGAFPMPTAGYVTDDFYQFVSMALPFYLILTFIYPYFVISGAVVQEKASKIKEGLRMMGASLTSYWLSIYLYYGIKFTVIAFLCTLISWATNVFKYSEFLIIFIWFALFLYTLLTSAIMLSTLFDNPKTASMVSSIFLLTLGFMFVAGNSMNKESQKTWLCLSGPACFGMSINIFGKYEEGLLGITWQNINEPYQYLRFSTVLIMMFADCIIYTILAMYLDRVIPSKYGQRLPPYFIFQQSFWFPNAAYLRHEAVGNEDDVLLKSKKYERVDKKEDASIQVRRLKKTFSTGYNSEPFVAVNGITLNIYENEIFCLLGHNGAGKTTTISMLTGMLNITSGEAKINGHDAVTEMSQIRESLGVCPQHDVLFPRLTVEEHLTLFANLKGVDSKNVKQEVNAMIYAVKMQDKRDKFPTQLSGGQKRKLSLGIALIGGSKIVFLDEPTSGMDPHSRRDAWELIKASAKGRTIILTTHFMDEADILADRIAIMAKGEIQCCGSSLFLKKLYGVGYSFAVSVNADIPILNVRDEINDLVLGQINSSQLLSSHGTELIYRLPFESSKEFPSLFRLIDEQKKSLHIESYGVSVTTLEEVFIKVGHGEGTLNDMTEEVLDFKDTLEERRRSSDMVVLSDELDKIRADENDKAGQTNMTVQDMETRTSSLERQWTEFLEDARSRSQKNLFGAHIYAILYKKWNYTKRDKRALLCQLVLPIVFMVLGFALMNFKMSVPSEYPRLALDMTHFGLSQPAQIPYNTESQSSVNPFPKLWKHLPAEYGTLLPLDGGDNGNPYESDSTTRATLHTFGDSMLAVSGGEPPKYVSYYFPIHNGTAVAFDGSNDKIIEASRHIGVGANISAVHSLPISVQMASNLALKQVLPSAFIKAYIQPLPTTKQESDKKQQENEEREKSKASVYSIFLSFGLAFFPVGIMYNIVYEKESLAKLQLLVSGINVIAYWLGNYIFDAITILPSCLSAIVLVYVFNATSFIGESLLPFILILFLYGIAIVPFTYLFSWLFKTSTRAQYVALLSFIFFGFGFSFTTFIMEQIPDTQNAAKILKRIAQFSPSYCSARAMLNLALKDITPIPGLWELNDPPFAWEITGSLLTWMAIDAVLCFGLTLLVEYLSTIPSVNALFGSATNLPKQPMNLDEDVKAEQDRLKKYVIPNDNGPGEDGFDFKQIQDPIVIAGLRKVYNTGSLKKGGKGNNDKYVVAVKDLWYSVPRGQVFGFLGVNGAGKTSTLSMLCGKFAASEGMAYINQIPISNQIACRRMIGYCPQFDAIFDLLTAREHLTVYGMIKGLSKADVKEQAEQLMESLTLSPYSDKRAGAYSGGNKRKLSVAMAMIGEPPIVFLDEPSTGMDPVARRHMWDFISQTMNGRAVILTTHSMEECEALCHRIGIMVKGQLRCIGSSQRLKMRYGKGFQLDCNIAVEKQEMLTNELTNEFGQKVEILEKHDENIKYTISGVDGVLSLADMFEKLEVINDKIGIDGGYALNQTTLEQIFIQMAAEYEHTEQQQE